MTVCADPLHRRAGMRLAAFFTKPLASLTRGAVIYPLGEHGASQPEDHSMFVV